MAGEDAWARALDGPSQTTFAQPDTAPHQRREIPSLNGLRAISFLIVFWGHAKLPHFIDSAVGVTVFFFLSGFLITTLLRVEFDLHGAISLRNFYLRRILRIWPPLYVVLAAAIVLAATRVIPNGKVTARGVAALALQISNYWTTFHGNTGLISTVTIFWSLAVEEHFYLLFPLLFIALAKLGASRKQIAWVLALIAIVICIWRTSLTFPFDDAKVFQRVYYATGTRADSILWGCVMALVANPALGDRIIGGRWFWSYVALPAALAVFYFAQVSDHFYWSVGFTVQAAAIAVIFVAAIQWPRDPLGRLLNWRPLVLLGGISYTTYLTHRMVLYFLRIQITGHHVLLTAAVALPVTIGVAWLSYVVLERPCAQLRRRLSRAWEIELPARA